MTRDIGRSRVYALGRYPTGVLISAVTTSGGERVAKVRSFQQLQTGDKVSTGHGQKGVVTVKPYDDMPVAVLKTGESIIPDMVVAMSSIICRQTNGQLYETHRAVNAIQESKIQTIEAGETSSVMDEVYVRSGTTGKMYTTAVGGSGRMSLTKASLGFIRVHNQTQMTRERHFTSHRKVKSSTLRTPTSRPRGGGVALGGMHGWDRTPPHRNTRHRENTRHNIDKHCSAPEARVHYQKSEGLYVLLS